MGYISEYKPDTVSLPKLMIECSLRAAHCAKIPMPSPYPTLITLEVMMASVTILKAITASAMGLSPCARPSAGITRFIFAITL